MAPATYLHIPPRFSPPPLPPDSYVIIVTKITRDTTPEMLLRAALSIWLTLGKESVKNVTILVGDGHGPVTCALCSTTCCVV